MKSVSMHGHGILGRVFETIKASAIGDGDMITDIKNLEYKMPTQVWIVSKTDKTVLIRWEAHVGVPAEKRFHLNDIVLREIGDRLG